MDDRRVAVEVTGGLGNQLFQYAAGRALAKRLEAQLVLDCTTREASPRKFALDRFSIQAAVIHNGPTTIPQRYFNRVGLDHGQISRRVSERRAN